MGELILCSHPLASVPYYIENGSLNIYSLEELCYYIENNPYLLGGEFLNRGLCLWIQQEIGQTDTAEKLMDVIDRQGTIAEFVTVILDSCDYCTAGEKKIVLALLQEVQNKSPFECGKIRADRYMQQRSYGKAIMEYRGLLQEEEKGENDVIQKGNLYHNLGVAYAQLFLFKDAIACFRLAYEKNKNISSIEACLAVCSLAGENEILKKYKESYGITDEMYRIMSEHWKDAQKAEAAEESSEKPENLPLPGADGEDVPLAEKIQTIKKEYKNSSRV